MANELYQGKPWHPKQISPDPDADSEGLCDKPPVEERPAARKPKSALAEGEKAGPRVGARKDSCPAPRRASVRLLKEEEAPPLDKGCCLGHFLHLCICMWPLPSPSPLAF
ncbi:uncharacterized protein LOC119001088 [Sturnira hondurensis]|uniref:uncharacterized protein LOC119001088 n=1 Tax=Sturnira hondurensis TaxID=192404 RepID=UPI001879149A|nr:uncharacterized protein LOC119001088 [Sturnira hondurensis]